MEHEHELHWIARALRHLLEQGEYIMSTLQQIQDNEALEGTAVGHLADAVDALIAADVQLRADLQAALATAGLSQADQAKVDGVFATQQATIDKVNAELAKMPAPTVAAAGPAGALPARPLVTSDVPLAAVAPGDVVPLPHDPPVQPDTIIVPTVVDNPFAGQQIVDATPALPGTVGGPTGPTGQTANTGVGQLPPVVGSDASPV
jgi:hypothetical protein